MRHARDRITELTDRSRLLLPVEVTWSRTSTGSYGAGRAYFRYGNSAVRFGRSGSMRGLRIALVHRASATNVGRGFGWSVLAYQSPDHLRADLACHGIVVAPRAFQGLAGEAECRR